jgi:hypothetical protein
MFSSHAVRALALLALCGAGAGCTTIGARSAEPGEVTHVLGSLQVRVEASVQRVHEAAETVVEDLGLRIESSAATLVDARIVAFTAQDKKLAIDLEGLADETCLISIRGGTFGDRKLSQQIYERIQAEL